MFSEVNAHTLESVCGQQRDQRRILFFELVSDVLEGFPHRIFDHFFFGLFHFFESSIEVIKHLTHKGRALAFKLLPDSRNPLFIQGDRVDKELYHVTKL